MVWKICFFALAFAGGFLSSPLRAELQGDPAAILLAEKIVKKIGGKEIWAGARTLYVVEKSRTPSQGDGIVAEFWRDLEQPRWWFHLNSRGSTRTFWWDQNGVYEMRDGKDTTSSLSEDLHAFLLNYWPGEIYVMYQRFAKGDPSLRLEMEGENSFSAFEQPGGRKLGTFWVNVDGDMYRWRHGNEERPVEYIYGPHKSFGAINFPEWGTQVDGSWSFYYIEVRILNEPLPVSFDPPE